MSLIGKTLFGNAFIQDTKKEWIKIDNVTVGESPQYGYTSLNTKDIGGLLDRSLNDQKITVIIYEWATGKAYTKTGFNVDKNGIPTDVKSIKGFTSFIVKSRVPIPTQPTQPTQPIPTQPTQPTQPKPTPLGFVKTNGTKFVLNGKPFFPVGFNAYWLGLMEDGSYPTKAQIEEMFIIAKQISATVIRSHTLASSSGYHYNSLMPNRLGGKINNDAWDAIDYSFSMAKKYNIKLIVPLTDAYSYYHGSYGDFCSIRGVNKTEFWTNGNVRSDFKNFIKEWLNHVNKYTKVAIKNDPSLCMIELGNELGQIRPDAGSTTIPTEDWIRDISSFIKTIDRNHLVLNGSDECLGQSNDFNISSLDVYSAHFYWFDLNRLDYGANSSAAINKPYIVGEYSSKWNNDWFSQIEKRKNISGSVFWSMYPHTGGYKSGNRIPHEDGFTLHYPEDSSQLLLIANHFRRMQSLSPLNNI
jgi:mannan endo-1,4-beta-mannosidase